MSKSVDIDSLLTRIEREECIASFYEFLQSFWSVIIKEKPVFNWHIPALCDELQELSVFVVRREKKPYDIIINIPPGTTKSTIVTIMFPVWLWTQDPTIRIITNSYSAEISTEHAVKSRDIIQSEKFRRLFPEIMIRRDKAGKENYENTETGARYTTSTGGAITGKHAHIIINDDPLNPKQAASEAQRKEANEHTKTLSSRKVDKENTPTILVMQRLHEDDPTGNIMKKKADRVKHICLPATDSINVKPESMRARYIDGMLDPVRLSRSILEDQLIDLGSRAYSCQFDQEPVADGGNIIQKDWFRKISREEFNRIRGAEPIVFFIDTAFTNNMANDPTGLIATCRIGKNLYITNAVSVYMKFPELCRFVPAHVRRNGYTGRSTIRIEPKANGISVVDQLEETTGLNVTQIKGPIVSDSKETRLNSASPKVECGRVYLVEDVWNEEFVDQISGFPAKTHDEYVDLLSYSVDYHLSEGGEDTDLDALEDELY